MKELKSCPFCGGKGELQKAFCELDNYVMCLDCRSRTKLYNTKESVIKSWNKRNAWIPCKERLPKEHEEVYVTLINYTGERMTSVDVFENGKFYHHSKNVIAWQPLPPKYEG